MKGMAEVRADDLKALIHLARASLGTTHPLVQRTEAALAPSVSAEIVPFHRPPTFEDFYATYPRKKEPKKARKAWDKAIKEGADPHVIVASAQRWAEHVARGVEFVKYPATWLNNGCWDDELDERDLGQMDRTTRNRHAIAEGVVSIERAPTFQERLLAASMHPSALGSGST